MKIINFIDILKINEKNEAEKATLLCFYHSKEGDELEFSLSRIASIMIDSGYNAPNTSRLKEQLIKGKNKAFIVKRNSCITLSFIPAVYQRIEKEIGYLWENDEEIESEGTLIDENKFCGKRNYLDKLIFQINHSYENNCYDAAAVLMRRLFELLLIMAYQNIGIDNEIKDPNGSGYKMLDGIVKNAIGNSKLKLSRIKMDFDSFRLVGNNSAHGIFYIAGKKDIDDIKIKYRVMLEELYNKAGLI
jgi:hypothetical protein